MLELGLGIDNELSGYENIRIRDLSLASTRARSRKRWGYRRVYELVII